MLKTTFFKFIITILLFVMITPFWTLYALIVDYKAFRPLLEVWQEIIDFNNWRE